MSFKFQANCLNELLVYLTFVLVKCVVIGDFPLRFEWKLITHSQETHKWASTSLWNSTIEGTIILRLQDIYEKNSSFRLQALQSTAPSWEHVSHKYEYMALSLMFCFEFYNPCTRLLHVQCGPSVSCYEVASMYHGALTNGSLICSFTKTKTAAPLSQVEIIWVFVVSAGTFKRRLFT